MHKKILTTIMTVAIIATVGLAISSMVQTNVYAAGGKYQPVTNDVPTEEWFSFKGITLQPGEFLDMVDTTPFLTTRGHVAMYIPCNSDGTPKISFVQGIVDVGVNTLSPVHPEYLSQLSTPGQNCLYHFDIGTPSGVTDFAIINTSHDPIVFGDRNTATFSIAEGLKKLSG